MRKIFTISLGLIPFAVILLVWQFVSGRVVSIVYLPPISAIFNDLLIAFTSGNHLYSLRANSVLTLERALLGFTIAVAIGVPVGVGIGLSKRISKLLEPTTEVFRVLPGIVLIPFFVLLIGINQTFYVVFVAFGAVWPILINTIDGVKGVEPMYFAVAKSFRITGIKNFVKITVPGASPYIFSGMRVSLLLCLLVTIAAEMVTGHNGLGFSVFTAMEFSNITMLYAQIFLIGVIGFLLNGAFIVVEARLMAWHKNLQRS